MKNKVLVVTAHPDDEVLGCGGTIAKHHKNGDEVTVIILAEGLTSRDDKRNRDAKIKELSLLKKQSIEANKILGVNDLQFFDFPDNRMDSVDLLDVVKAIENCINKFKPNIVYTHHSGDVNIDHRIIHDAVVVACRPIPDHTVKTLLFFEVASSSEWQPNNSYPNFIPNWFVDISQTLDLKLKALKKYKSEMRKFPHPRSIKALECLANWRGASVGVDAAESFILGRLLV
ncbi:MAG: PIG-L family deacetylase [bacterium]